jgi:hypothetical protein
MQVAQRDEFLFVAIDSPRNFVQRPVLGQMAAIREDAPTQPSKRIKYSSNENLSSGLPLWSRVRVMDPTYSQ